ncbi:MAG: hypothetical protein ACTH5B_17865 [Marinomonas sp.]|uniref:hypothetical protein n=1 Tax=Marinomonas sp. TaxID=1904862 RepID=UPI003F952A8B
MQTENAFNKPTEWTADIKRHCAIEIAAQKYGPTNKCGTISLINAAAQTVVKWKGSAHSAVADTLALVDLVQAMAVVGHE